jgi:hypothetical protein
VRQDDRKHRAAWRELYDADELAALAAAVQSCARSGVDFVYGISPGLDMETSSHTERALLLAKV